ncbi:MAG: HIT domain-containing protein [Opitutales bacterium]
MQRLHSYWRMEYVEATKYPEGQNPFQELPRLSSDREALIVHRGATSYILMNRYPYNAGHLLVIPYREVSDLSLLDVEERTELMNLVVEAKEILQKAINPDGFNIGFNLGTAAGAGVPSHLHCHIVPRWDGDTNFMPVLGDTRVLPTSLEAMWERLRSFSPNPAERET